jgi:hypothetical protein
MTGWSVRQIQLRARDAINKLSIFAQVGHVPNCPITETLDTGENVRQRESRFAEDLEDGQSLIGRVVSGSATSASGYGFEQTGVWNDGN